MSIMLLIRLNIITATSMFYTKKIVKLLSCTASFTVLHLSNAQTAQENLPVAADAEYYANWGLDVINALPAYLKGFTGKGVVVAVVDSGFDVNHPEYAGRVSPFIFNFGVDQSPENVFPGFDEADNSFDGHGDHVAGIIGASRNGSGMQGVAYDSTLMPLRAIIAGGPDLMPSPESLAIMHAADHGAKVINGSYGPQTLPKLHDDNGDLNPNYEILDYQLIQDKPAALREEYNALKYAADKDVVMVFSAGNERLDQPGAYTAFPVGSGMLPLITRDFINSGKIRFLNHDDHNIERNNPSTYSFLSPNDPVFSDMDFSDLKGSLIVVVSVDRQGNIASYSNECGETAEWCIAAPGGFIQDDNEDGIYSTWPQGDPNNNNLNYKYLQGTSMASPHVAGAAAVVRSAFPYMNARQTIETILTTTTKSGFEDQDKFGQGLLNLGSAIDGPMSFRYNNIFDVDTQGYSSTWSNSISGVGGLIKRGDGVLVLAGQNNYQGPTHIIGGILEINGSVTSEMHVSQAGQLAGSGVVGDLTLTQGGKVSPGSAINAQNAIGTLTVNGNFTQESGSSYVAGLAIGTSADKIVINGTAQLNSNASLELALHGAGRGNASARYTLLSASNGVSGTYDNLSGSLAQTPFIDYALDYDANNVFLKTSRSNVAFANVAITNNQMATAVALESQGEGKNIYDYLLFLNRDQVRQAYDQLSGEAYASMQSSLVNNSLYTRSAAYNQLSKSFSKPSNLPKAITTYLAQPNFWAHSFGGWTKQSGNQNVAHTESSIGGFLTGIDIEAFDDWRFGVLAGYSHTNFHLNERQSSGKSNDYTIGAYGGTEVNYAQGTLAFRSGLAHTWHNIDMNRSVAFVSFNDKLFADYKAGTFQIFGELGYKHQSTEQLCIEPYANLAYVHLKTNSFSEKDRNGAALNVHKSSMSTVLTSIGLRIAADINEGFIPINARADIAWRHAFADTAPVSKAEFSGSDAFAISGAMITRNTASISVGLDFQFKENAVLGISYQGQFGSGINQNGLNTNLSIKF